MMAVIGFNSEGDFRRANRAIRAYEGQRVNQVMRRGRYPVTGGGASTELIPYIITQVGEDDENLIFYRCSTTVVGRRCTDATWADDGSDEGINLTLFAPSITATGCVVLCANLFGSLYAIAGIGSPILLSCTADADIQAGDSGDVTVSYNSAIAADQTASLPNITNESGMLASSGATLRVLYDAMRCSLVIDAVECA